MNKEITSGDELPAVLFDSYAVLQEVQATGPNPPRTSADNVVEVLDAVVRLMKKGRAVSAASTIGAAQTAEQVLKAEVAELPPLPKLYAGNYAIHELVTLLHSYGATVRDAIAASRRAAGGEPIYQVRRKPMNGVTFDWRDVSEERYRTQYVEDEWNEKRVVYAAQPVEYAGQAGQATIITDEDMRMLHAVAGYMRRNDSPRCSADLTKLALKLDAIRNATMRTEQ